LTGSGTIRANGGSVDWGAGAGGRIAIVLSGVGADFTLWNGAMTTYGGAVSYPAGAGTIYRANSLALDSGTVLVDNQNTATNWTYTSLPPSTNSPENLAKTLWVAQNKGKIGLLTNAAVASLTVSNNAYLELAGNTLTVNTLAITNKAYAVGTYTAGQLSALVSDSPGGGSVVVLGAFQGSMFIFR
jgi:hypothetical protein